MYEVIIKTTSGEKIAAQFRDREEAMDLYNDKRLEYDTCSMEPLVIRAENICEMKLNPQNITSVEFREDPDMRFLKNRECIGDMPPCKNIEVQISEGRHEYYNSDDIPLMDDEIAEALLSHLVNERGIHIDDLTMCTALMLDVPYSDLFDCCEGKTFDEHGAWWMENKKVLTELQSLGLVYGDEGIYIITLAGARFYIKSDRITLDAAREYCKGKN